MTKKEKKELAPFLIINIGSKENPILKYKYKEEK
jgi:hypothetical protein